MAQPSGLDNSEANAEKTHATAEAVTLLLRSPRWSVSAVMELMEIGDSEFRRLVEQNRKLARVLQERKADDGFDGLTERQCKACGDSFRTATFRSYCGSPACRKVEQLDRRR